MRQKLSWNSFLENPETFGDDMHCILRLNYK